MTYNPREYWTSAPPMTIWPAHADQEAELMATIGHLGPASILEIGVGFGRIGGLLTRRWPDARYVGVDISPDRVAEARARLDSGIDSRVEVMEADIVEWVPYGRYDLVIAVEVLMHIRPADLAGVIEKMKRTARQHVYTVDWVEPIHPMKAVAPWNFLHDYAAHGLQLVTMTGRQGIHHWEWPDG